MWIYIKKISCINVMKQKEECNECGKFRVLNTEYDSCNPCVKKHKQNFAQFKNDVFRLHESNFDEKVFNQIMQDMDDRD